MINNKKYYTLTQAANLTGISRQALHKRITRGQIAAYKDENGNWQVELDDKLIHKKQDQSEYSDQLVQVLRDQVNFLRTEIERQNYIIMNLTNKIPQLEEGKRLTWLQRLFRRE